MAIDWVYSSGKVQLNNRIMNLNAQPIEFNNMAADPTNAAGKWWIFAESDVLWAMDLLYNRRIGWADSHRDRRACRKRGIRQCRHER